MEFQKKREAYILEELINRAKNKDKEAFTQAVLAIQTELYFIAKTKLNNEEDINDAMQETMMISFKNIHKLRENRFFKTWMIKILLNQCNKIYKKKPWNEISLEEKEIPEVGLQENNINFEQLISHLTKENQTILTLYYVSGYTTKEISSILSKNESTIRSKIMRAKEQIRKEQEGE